MMLAQALKAVQAQNDLLLDTGIFERAPDRLFKVVASVKPTEIVGATETVHRSREQAIKFLIEKMMKASPGI